MRIYDGDFTVARLVESCSKPRRESTFGDHQSEPREIDLKKLNATLAELPVDAIRKRRRRMNAFYEEVLVSSDPDKGISFTTLLMILAHYNVINDNKSLRFVHATLKPDLVLTRIAGFMSSFAAEHACNVWKKQSIVTSLWASLILSTGHASSAITAGQRTLVV